MSVLLVEGSWSAAIHNMDDRGRFTPVGWRRTIVHPSQWAREGAPLRSYVELKGPRGPSCIAAIGGEWSPAASDSVVEIAESGELTLGMPADQPTHLGVTLVPGLPDEFAAAALEGFLAAPCPEGLVAGNYRIDRAAYDEAESSPIMFNRAAGLLRCALGSRALGEDLDQEPLRMLLRSWHR